MTGATPARIAAAARAFDRIVTPALVAAAMTIIARGCGL